MAARPDFTVPTDPAVVLERLPAGYASLMPSGAPHSDLMAEAEKLLSAAGATGDARLATRAETLLAARSPGEPTDRVLRARAFAAQHRHAFTEAVGILDKLIARSPRDGDARLSRAQIETLRGHLKRARSDCAVLALGVDTGRGLLCVAALALRQGEFSSAANVLERWLAQAPAADPSRRYALVMRGEIASRARVEDADRWFDTALRLAPQDVRTLAAYARHLRSQGRHEEIISMLVGAPEHDGLALQRALAAQALQLPSRQALLAAQARRYALARRLGTTPELRDEAELMLATGIDPRRALSLAEQNFRSQRDFEDVDILRRAAKAARDQAALNGLNQWLREHALAADSQSRTQ
ncbi:MAG: hypothetical protein H7Y19_05470 [Luteimonas sp.]|nr:hypothetical protein [Luteimonas sp.]